MVQLKVCGLLLVYLLILLLHSYEKMISGMYMGEIARLVIVECAEKGLLFKGNLSDELREAHRFHTKYVSEIEK